MPGKKINDYPSGLVSLAFWDDHQVKAIRALKGGDGKAIFLQRLCFASYHFGGWLKFSSTQNYDDTTLAAAFDLTPEYVRESLSDFERYGTAEETPDGLHLLIFAKLFMSLSKDAKKKREQRDSLKQREPKKRESAEGNYGDTSGTDSGQTGDKRESGSPYNPFRKKPNGNVNPNNPQPPRTGDGLTGRDGDSGKGGTADPRLRKMAEDFKAAYPKKGDLRSRLAVEKWFADNNPSDELFSEIMGGLGEALLCDKWREEGGRYIPQPQNFLANEAWTAYLKPVLPKTAEEKRAEEEAKISAEVNAHPERYLSSDELLRREAEGQLDDSTEAELKRRRDSGEIKPGKSQKEPEVRKADRPSAAPGKKPEGEIEGFSSFGKLAPGVAIGGGSL